MQKNVKNVQQGYCARVLRSIGAMLFYQPTREISQKVGVCSEGESSLSECRLLLPKLLFEPQLLP